jgi:hypothetical protein
MIPPDTPVGMDNCGIATVAMLAGVSYAEAESIFLSLCDKADMTTVWDRLQVMEFLGVQLDEDVHYRIKPTLTGWWEKVSDGPSVSRYHVTMTGHVVAIDRGLLFDQVFRRGIHPLRSPYKRKRITSYQRLRL